MSTKLQVLTQGVKVAIPASDQPDYPISTKTKRTKSWSALVSVMPYGCAILHSPIHTIHGITIHKHPSLSKYKTRAIGNRARIGLTRSRPLVRVLGC